MRVETGASDVILKLGERDAVAGGNGGDVGLTSRKVNFRVGRGDRGKGPNTRAFKSVGAGVGAGSGGGGTAGGGGEGGGEGGKRG